MPITTVPPASSVHPGQQKRLEKVGLSATVKRDSDGGLIRIGPLAHAAAWLALEAFLGRPL